LSGLPRRRGGPGAARLFQPLLVLLPVLAACGSVEYALDERTIGGTATQVFEYGRERPELFSPIMSDADHLPLGNRLMTSGSVSRNLTYVDSKNFTGARDDSELVKVCIIEVDPQGNVEFEMTMETESTARGEAYRAQKLVLTP
jgi:hypothetical protein